MWFVFAFVLARVCLCATSAAEEGQYRRLCFHRFLPLIVSLTIDCFASCFLFLTIESGKTCGLIQGLWCMFQVVHILYMYLML